MPKFNPGEQVEILGEQVTILDVFEGVNEVWYSILFSDGWADAAREEQLTWQ